jgi:imidazolonepropionase-like amidohydrolase
VNRILFVNGQVFDGTGATVMPGLVESHAHLTFPSALGRNARDLALLEGRERRARHRPALRRIPAEGHTAGSWTLTRAERPPCTTASASFSTRGSSAGSLTVTP